MAGPGEAGLGTLVLSNALLRKRGAIFLERLHEALSTIFLG